MYNWRSKRVLVTGGSGFLGRVLVSKLREKGCSDITIPRSKSDDLRERGNCDRVVRDQDLVFHLAANVGGIAYNLEKPGDIFYDNIMMGVQMMDAARKADVEKFIGIGTICSYPCFAPTPFKEESIWDGYPEPTNAPYGLAKKMLLVQSQAYRKQHGFNSIVLFPTNLYGPGDRFDPRYSHVIPALIRRIYEAAQSNQEKLVVWGDGSATREFLYVEDAARAIVMAAEFYNKSEPVNIGSGEEVSIRDLVSMLCEIMSFRGSVEWDKSKPNGQPRRKVDSARAFAEFSFNATVPISTGLTRTVDWYQSHEAPPTQSSVLRDRGRSEAVKSRVSLSYGREML